jgi:hypothetical protein
MVTRWLERHNVPLDGPSLLLLIALLLSVLAALLPR